MAVDLAPLLSNLRSLHSFEGARVLSVGAGGGQLVEVYRQASHILAVDIDESALAQLRVALMTKPLQERLETRCLDFLQVQASVDVVVFEFSLHEMPDPEAALDHGCQLAPVVVVYDHAPDSPWAESVVEEDKVARSTAALLKLYPSRVQYFDTEQRFPDHAALVAKVGCQGPEALIRAQRFQGMKDITIPMRYLGAVLGQVHATLC